MIDSKCIRKKSFVLRYDCFFQSYRSACTDSLSTTITTAFALLAFELFLLPIPLIRTLPVAFLGKLLEYGLPDLFTMTKDLPSFTKDFQFGMRSFELLLTALQLEPLTSRLVEEGFGFLESTFGALGGVVVERVLRLHCGFACAFLDLELLGESSSFEDDNFRELGKGVLGCAHFDEVGIVCLAASDEWVGQLVEVGLRKLDLLLQLTRVVSGPHSRGLTLLRAGCFPVNGWH